MAQNERATALRNAALRPELVVEASADHITDRHFRHGARILRWSTDKDSHTCTMDQIER